MVYILHSFCISKFRLAAELGRSKVPVRLPGQNKEYSKKFTFPSNLGCECPGFATHDGSDNMQCIWVWRSYRGSGFRPTVPAAFSPEWVAEYRSGICLHPMNAHRHYKPRLVFVNQCFPFACRGQYNLKSILHFHCFFIFFGLLLDFHTSPVKFYVFASFPSIPEWVQ